MRKTVLLACVVASLAPISYALDDDALAALDDARYEPSERINAPQAQQPPIATTQNSDTGKPFQQWQRLTDDWFGLRPWLDDRGVNFEANITLDGSKNFMGGAQTSGDAWRNLFNANLTFDLERLANLKGATVFLNFQNQAGRDGTELTGNALGLSNIDADGRTQLSELWYEQKFLDDKLRLKIGKVDASSEFNVCEHAADFVSPSFTQNPNILGFPSYPDPSTSVNLFLSPTEHFYANFGLYDGTTQKGTNSGPYGPANFLGAGLFLVAETGAKWELSNKRTGTAGIGLWHHTGDFEELEDASHSSPTGAYFVADQILYRPNPDDDDSDRGLSLFLRYAWAPAEVSEIEHNLAVGLSWSGPFQSRPDDAIGLGLSAAKFSPHAGTNDDYELVVELFYKIRLFKYLTLQPDIQYIHNPGGLDSQDDALAATLRIVAEF